MSADVFASVEATTKRIAYIEFIRALYGLPYEAPALPPGLPAELATGRDEGWILFVVDAFGVVNGETAAERQTNWNKFALPGIFPSTTAVFMTCMHTAQAPQQHGVSGWWTYAERIGKVVSTLNSRERESDMAAEHFGYRRDIDIASSPALPAHAGYDFHWFVPSSIAGGPYGAWGQGAMQEYDAIPYSDNLDLVRVFAHTWNRREKKPRWVIYFPDYDWTAHRHGAQGAAALKVLDDILASVHEMTAIVGGKLPMYLTADHGMIDVPREKSFVMPHDDPILDHLVLPPYSEPRLPICLVKPGHESDFRAIWSDRPWARSFELRSRAELVDLGLFSRDSFSPTALAQWEALTALPTEPAVIQYLPASHKPLPFIGYHGSSTRTEMLVPVWSFKA